MRWFACLLGGTSRQSRFPQKFACVSQLNSALEVGHKVIFQLTQCHQDKTTSANRLSNLCIFDICPVSSRATLDCIGLIIIYNLF